VTPLCLLRFTSSKRVPNTPAMDGLFHGLIESEAMPAPIDRLDELLVSLAAGARRHASRDPAARAGLALACAERVADRADDWVRAAVALKQGGTTAIAEEIATGPLGTLRLLLLTARAQQEIAQGGLPRALRPPRLSHAAAGNRSRASDPASMVEVDVMPVAALFDAMIFGGHRATVRESGRARCLRPQLAA